MLTDCWKWVRSIKAGNYPRVKVAGKMKLAHVVSWERANGPVPDGLCVLHKCDNRVCTNPDHLFLGTRQDNQADMVSKDRSAHGERNGHAKLTLEQVLMIKALSEKTSQKVIAAMFGVNPCSISRIVSGKRWRRVS